MLIYVCLLAAAVVAVSAELEYTPCPGSEVGLGRILTLSSSQFNPGDKILLKKGQVYDFQVNFVAGEDAEVLTPTIFGIINNTPVPWRGVNRNACTDLVGEGCPIVNGKTYTYFAKIPVLPTYPTVSLEFQWALTSINGGTPGNNQICFRMPATIVN